MLHVLSQQDGLSPTDRRDESKHLKELAFTQKKTLHVLSKWAGLSPTDGRDESKHLKDLAFTKERRYMFCLSGLASPQQTGEMRVNI